ncbi:MAG: DUF3575 domain-containing protein [Acidobacteriota bacterium]
MNSTRSRYVYAVFAAVLLSAPPVLAAPQEGTKTPVPHDQILSANPFGLMLRWWNVEYERKVTGSSTWGVAASFLTAGDLDFGSVNALYRYYPQGAALSGFFLGGRAGYYRGWDDDETGFGLGLGFEIGYTWLLGRHRNIGLSLGTGLTRIVAGNINDGPSVLPTVRLLNLGIAF